LDSATAGLLPPLRQISLDVIAASEFNRAKGMASGAERQNIFQDVFDQVSWGWRTFGQTAWALLVPGVRITSQGSAHGNPCLLHSPCS
jgi:hypothetical protein